MGLLDITAFEFRQPISVQASAVPSGADGIEAGLLPVLLRSRLAGTWGVAEGLECYWDWKVEDLR
jgi:hypothetical protein